MNDNFLDLLREATGQNDPNSSAYAPIVNPLESALDQAQAQSSESIQMEPSLPVVPVFQYNGDTYEGSAFRVGLNGDIGNAEEVGGQLEDNDGNLSDVVFYFEPGSIGMSPSVEFPMQLYRTVFGDTPDMPSEETQTYAVNRSTYKPVLYGMKVGDKIYNAEDAARYLDEFRLSNGGIRIPKLYAPKTNTPWLQQYPAEASSHFSFAQA